MTKEREGGEEGEEKEKRKGEKRFLLANAFGFPALHPLEEVRTRE